MNRIKNLLLVLLISLLCSNLFAKGDSYIYDYWGDIEKSPDTYRVANVLFAHDLNLGSSLKNPSGLFCINDSVYLVDTDNNRILELTFTKDKKLVYKRTIDKINTPEGIVDTFLGPKDIFVDASGFIYVADTNNGRVVKVDSNLNLVLQFLEPDDPTYKKGKSFLPEKVVADSKGRVYILAKNVNRGFIKYEYDGTFSGFYGAGDVVVNWTDYVWKMFSTKAQRAQLESFVPTEYSNVYIDNEGFLFSVTKTFEELALHSGEAKPIRRLNALGDDILITNAEYLPIGDVDWGNAGGIKGPAHFSDITVLDNEVYVAVDETRGRIFGYDSQGYLLYAFGGRGNINGFFTSPAAIEHIGRDLFVLDSMNASITVLSPTEYGDLIYDATELYARGEYDQSADVWKQVLGYNGNYDLAYIGLGKSYIRQEKYKEAMELFKLKRDRRDYSKAFKYYRQEWLEKNIYWLIAVVLALILIPFIIKQIKKFKKELMSL